MPTPSPRGLRALFACALLTAAAGLARADTVPAGNLVVDSYSLFQTTQKAGADITMHYELNAAAKQFGITPDKLRWIQLLRLSKPIFFGDELTPERPFIDPRKDQFAPGTPTGKGDDLPFYDFSYPTAADVGKKDKTLVNGSGVYMTDQPRVGMGARPFSFTATTLLVAVLPDQKLVSLGGVRWGYRVKDDLLGTTEVFPLDFIPGNSAVIRTFNTALNNDFPGWQIVVPSSVWKDNQPTLKLVPAPPSALLLALGGLGVVGMRRRKRPAAG